VLGRLNYSLGGKRSPQGAVRLSIEHQFQLLDNIFWQRGKLRLVGKRYQGPAGAIVNSDLERLKNGRQTFDVALDGQITEHHHTRVHLAVMDGGYHGDEEGNTAGGFDLTTSQFHCFNYQVFLSNSSAQTHLVLVGLQKRKGPLERFLELSLHR